MSQRYAPHIDAHNAGVTEGGFDAPFQQRQIGHSFGSVGRGPQGSNSDEPQNAAKSPDVNGNQPPMFHGHSISTAPAAYPDWIRV